MTAFEALIQLRQYFEQMRHAAEREVEAAKFYEDSVRARGARDAYEHAQKMVATFESQISFNPPAPSPCAAIR